MLWFIIHHIIQNFSLMSDQTKNLLTFVLGSTLYTLFYSYLGSFDFSCNLMFKSLFNFFFYIILADGFAMAIIYKNYYKQTIFTEVRETLGTRDTQAPVVVVEAAVEESVPLQEAHSLVDT